MKTKTSSNGFTLVELLVVIAIIGILIGMLFPGLQAVRESARLSQCQMRLQTLHLAISEYHVAHGSWPIGTRNPKGPIESVAVGYHHNWIEALLPYMDRAVMATGDERIPDDAGELTGHEHSHGSRLPLNRAAKDTIRMRARITAPSRTYVVRKFIDFL